MSVNETGNIVDSVAGNIVDSVAGNSKNQQMEEIPTEKTKRKRQYINKNVRDNIIEDYKNGIEHNDYKVTPLSNGKYRVKRINENDSVAENKVATKNAETKVSKNNMNDIIYYNINNTLNEQIVNTIHELTKRVDSLSNKHKKMKNKYKRLKDTLFTTEEDENEDVSVAGINAVQNTADEHVVQNATDEHVSVAGINAVQNATDEHNRQRTFSRTTSRIDFNKYFM